jgi:hypothetical protein
MADETGEASTVERAEKARQQMLFSRWLNGRRLNVPELREIRPLIGDEAYARALALLGVSLDEAERAPSAVVGSDRARYANDLAHYVSTYGRGERQLKRWIAAGKAAQPPELPPLDEPAKMHGWWVKHMTQKPPTRIVELALAKNSAGARTDDVSGRSIDITQIEVNEGDELRTARGILAAVGSQLADAYRTNDDAAIDRLQRRWEKAMNAKRLAENAERSAKKQAGELVPVSELFPELSQLLATLRVMRTTMGRRIRARLTLPPDLDAKLDAIIEDERRGEEAVLRRLSFFRSLDEVENELQLSAA